MKHFFISIFIIIFCFFQHAFASDVSDILLNSKDKIINSLPNEYERIISDISPSNINDISTHINKLLKTVDTNRFIISSLKTLSKIMVVAIFSGVFMGFQKKSEIQIVTIASSLSIAGILFSDINGMLSLCTKTLEQTSIFSNTMLPIMAGAITLSGSPITASTTQTITMFALNFIIKFINNVLVPFICAYIAIITVNSTLANNILDSLGDFVKWLTTGSLKLILTIFIAYLSISGAISGSVDSVALKTAKFAVSGSVPVVGGIISDATESMLAGMVTIKNSLGIIGMFGVAAICIIPFFQVGINYIIFKAGTAAFSPICTPQVKKLLTEIGESFGLMLGMIGTCSSILFFELVFSILMVKPI